MNLHMQRQRNIVKERKTLQMYHNQPCSDYRCHNADNYKYNLPCHVNTETGIFCDQYALGSYDQFHKSQHFPSLLYCYLSSQKIRTETVRNIPRNEQMAPEHESTLVLCSSMAPEHESTLVLCSSVSPEHESTLVLCS